MTKTRKLSAVAAATFLTVLSLPGSSSAQVFGTVEGVWGGVYSYQTTISQPLMPPETFSGTGPADFVLSQIGGTDWQMSFVALTPQFTAGVYVPGILSPADPFGPTSATASLLPYGGPSGASFGNFSVTYDLILPGGQLVVGTGGAIADLTSIEYNSDLSQTFTFATFTGIVPEPSSIVPGGTAIAVIALVAWTRRSRPRSRPRMS
jgi:hypothetical protein